MAFFLPFYITSEELDYGEYLSAFRVKTPFQSLSHRDYLGAILNLGIERKCLGDLYVEGDCGYFYAIPSVSRHLLLSLDRIGRGGAKVEQITHDQVPAPKVEMKEREFTVKSMRLDAVAATGFAMSRTKAAELIASGAVQKNHRPVTKADAPVSQGDVISARGLGKFEVAEVGGLSKKGRTGILLRRYL
jgi:RNA-binding protein YlmH